jgi:hypothetical protein
MSWHRGASSSPEDQFAREVIALARGILGLKAKRVHEFALRIERPDGPPVTMNLHNIYADAQQVEGDARAERLLRAVLAAVPRPRPASWRDAGPLLMPAVRAASWANSMISTARPGAFSAVPFGKPLAPFVKVLCAIDSEHSMALATTADLTAWGAVSHRVIWQGRRVFHARRPRLRRMRSGPLVPVVRYRSDRRGDRPQARQDRSLFVTGPGCWCALWPAPASTRSA